MKRIDEHWEGSHFGADACAGNTVYDRQRLAKLCRSGGGGGSAGSS
jgi:hypothetical protein